MDTVEVLRNDGRIGVASVRNYSKTHSGDQLIHAIAVNGRVLLTLTTALAGLTSNTCRFTVCGRRRSGGCSKVD